MVAAWNKIKQFCQTTLMVITIISVILGAGYYLFNTKARTQDNQTHIGDNAEHIKLHCDYIHGIRTELAAIKAGQDVILKFYGINPQDIKPYTPIREQEFKSNTRALNLPDSININDLLNYNDSIAQRLKNYSYNH